MKTNKNYKLKDYKNNKLTKEEKKQLVGGVDPITSNEESLKETSDKNDVGIFCH
jgi:hypothetical protein